MLFSFGEKKSIKGSSNANLKRKRRLETMSSHSHDKDNLQSVLKNSLEIEEDLMRTYLITAERVHEDDELKERLQNFAEGNAKRTKQLLDELKKR